MKTQVIFLFNEEENDLYAYFPDCSETATYNLCYAHVGQHSSCSLAYYEESRQATYLEYKSLLEELISIGYELTVLNS
jgi:hypothetical protein